MSPKKKPAAPPKETYLGKLARRGKESHVYRKYQLIGLEISQILSDEKHKALYIKLAKEHDADGLLRLAKDIATRGAVNNKGAYFMTVLKGKNSPPPKNGAQPLSKRSKMKPKKSNGK